MKCIRCGKEMVNTIGGNYTCPSCNFAVNDLMYRPSNCDMPLPQGFGEQKGWICPVCGRGVAPWTSFCPCQINRDITWVSGTGTYTNLELKEFEKYANTNCEELKL